MMRTNSKLFEPAVGGVETGKALRSLVVVGSALIDQELIECVYERVRIDFLIFPL
jgi:hypothetical protein